MSFTRAGCLFFAFVYALVANPISSSATPLSVLIRDKGTITANDKLFNDFALVSSTVINGGSADTGLIDVTPLTNDPLDPGLDFSVPLDALGTPFGHQGASSVLFSFSFDVRTIDQRPLIKDNTLRLTDFTFDAGPAAFILVSEDLTNAGGTSIGDKLTIAQPGQQPGSSPNHFDAANFTPTNFVHVVKTIIIQGPGDNDGAFLTGFQQRFSEVPEPSSVTFGLLAIGGAVPFARRRKR
jgi:PEP-CTERM motif